jgi:hypothetical protein
MAKMFIFYGFAEGTKLTNRLAPALRAHNIEITENTDDADIIVTHSAGCFLLAKKYPKKIIVMTNPVCGPRRRLPIVITKKIWSDFYYCAGHKQLLIWMRKTLWNLFYIVARPRRNILMFEKAKQYEQSLPEVAAKQVVVLNNRLDPWAKCIPEDEILAKHYTFVTRPGCHDDLWLNPKRYLDILQ